MVRIGVSVSANSCLSVGLRWSGTWSRMYQEKPTDPQCRRRSERKWMAELQWWRFFWTCFVFYSIPAKDIRIVPSTTPEEVLRESLDVAQTDGEWELINIEIVPITLQIAVGNYSQIRLNVSTSLKTKQKNKNRILKVDKCVLCSNLKCLFKQNKAEQNKQKLSFTQTYKSLTGTLRCCTCVQS